MERPPDLILSGINHGSNSSVSSIYSGTLSAAREGSLQGIAAIGFSLCNYSHEADMATARNVARVIIGQALTRPLPPGHLLNVNIPDLPLTELKGIRVTRQAKGRWVEEFDQRVDPYGRKYYWLTGKFALYDEGDDADEIALKAGYVSVTPMSNDLTDPGGKASLQQWDFAGEWGE
jgi:5'-nucleotidase